MVKLSYAGRKIQGLKLGQTVAKDLRRRIPPGSGARAAAREPNTELDLNDKSLTDDGLLEITNALIDGIRFRDETHQQGAVRLTELLLKGNSLTAAGMAMLAPVIALSSGSLSKLDISDNDISISGEAERQDWRTFLKSFENCYLLKIVDFGGNPLGCPGLDVIAEVYLKSEVDFVEPDLARGGEELQVVSDELRDLALENSSHFIETTGQDEGDPEASKHEDERMYASTRGLRSVPYLIFTGSESPTVCSYHLWCLYMAHMRPKKLLEFLPAGKLLALPEGLDGETGILFSKDNLGPLGRNLFNLGAQFNRQVQKVEEDINALNNGEELDQEEFIRAREECKKTQVEMERVKYRAVLDVLTTQGVHAVALWDTSLKTMIIARAILLDDGDRPKPLVEQLEDDRSPEPTNFSDYALDPYASSSDSPWSNFIEEFPSLPGSPEKNTAKPVEVRSVSPAPLKRSTRRSSSGTSHFAYRNSSRLEATRMSSQAITRTPDSGAKEFGPFGLPIRLWTRIITEATDEQGLLSPQQQTRVIRYACDWNSITQELGINGGTEAEQIRKILNSMGCLVYSKFE